MKKINSTGYKHLTDDCRQIIESMMRNGFSQKKIAQHLGVDQSTISREISRNKGKRGYRHKQASRIAFDRMLDSRGPRL